MVLSYIIHSLFESNGFIIHNTSIMLIPNGECNYLLSGKLPTVRQSYLLSGKLPTVRHAPNRSIDMHPKGIDMHPKVSIDLHPTTAYFAPNNRILCTQPLHRHAPKRRIHAPKSSRIHAPNLCDFSKILKVCRMAQDLSKSVPMVFRTPGNPLITLFHFICNSKCHL